MRDVCRATRASCLPCQVGTSLRSTAACTRRACNSHPQKHRTLFETTVQWNLSIPVTNHTAEIYRYKERAGIENAFVYCRLRFANRKFDRYRDFILYHHTLVHAAVAEALSVVAHRRPSMASQDLDLEDGGTLVICCGH